MGLDVGDQVRSDATRFGEIAFFDGSWMRGPFRRHLDDRGVDRHRGRDESSTPPSPVGAVGVRAEQLTGSSGRFEVGTPVGTASVRGTRFAIDCTVSWAEEIRLEGSLEQTEPEEACAFTVVEGTVLLQRPYGSEYELVAGQRVAASDHRPTIGPYDLTDAEVRDDDWIARNLDVDSEKPGAESTRARRRRSSRLWRCRCVWTRWGSLASANRATRFASTLVQALGEPVSVRECDFMAAQPTCAGSDPQGTEISWRACRSSSAERAACSSSTATRRVLFPLSPPRGSRSDPRWPTSSPRTRPPFVRVQRRLLRRSRDHAGDP